MEEETQVRRYATLSVVLLVATTLMALPAYAGESCHKINAHAVAQNTPENPGPNGELTSTAQMRGGGLLQGTSDTIFAVGDIVFPEPPANPYLPYSGFITFTTNRGTLTVAVDGQLDLVTGAYWSEGPVTDSTGKLAGASGHLRFEGFQNFADLTAPYPETRTGEICVDLGGNGNS
jgi:hypothetical protein